MAHSISLPYITWARELCAAPETAPLLSGCLGMHLTESLGLWIYKSGRNHESGCSRERAHSWHPYSLFCVSVEMYGSCPWAAKRSDFKYRVWVLAEGEQLMCMARRHVHLQAGTHVCWCSVAEAVWCVQSRSNSKQGGVSRAANDAHWQGLWWAVHV